MPKRTRSNEDRISKSRKIAALSQLSVYEDYALLENEIRILSLNPASNLDDRICCSLEVVALRKRPMFDALSYTWESPVEGTTLADQFITLCGDSKRIKGNLFDALKRLRLEDRPRKLWIDALCIDQTNHMERSQQVEMMARIYRAAKNVQVWLGEDFHSHSRIALVYLSEVFRLREYLSQPEDPWRSLWSNEAKMKEREELLFARQTNLGKLIRAEYHENTEKLHENWRTEITRLETDIQNVHPIEQSSFKHELNVECKTPGTWLVSNALRKLFNRSYFKRRWVLQELHNAHHAIARCGSYTISWSKIEVAYNLHTLYSSPEIAWILRTECPVLWYGTSFRSPRAKGMRRLLGALYQVERSSCTDMRDKVYALLGLIGGDNTPLRPNYSLSTAETWIAVAKAGVKEGLAAELASMAASQIESGDDRIDGLPSWVPDFNTAQYLWPFDELQFDASVDPQTNRLTCSLLCTSGITFRNGWALSQDSTNEKAAVQKIIAAQSGPGDGIKDPYASKIFHSDSDLPIVWAPRGLKAGDLICRGMHGHHDFVVRALRTTDGPLSAHEQDWTVVGEAFGVSIEFWKRREPRRLRLI